MAEKEITKFEKEVLLQDKVSQLESELKEFSDLQKKHIAIVCRKALSV